ncbi:ligand-binding sensor domain-containing protein [Chondrinema litorale]|uniref:ligand-binding sensor domain-containing protein n=1 Tax=Chondrinema litorale TaxID=2994555 RepID=UPI002542BE82|nr:triple tyrosine motif-containing protein [Chondrinema litorale]UZR97425.1 triple tyrosine motif-containing protein [Chondrinema litorale]
MLTSNKKGYEDMVFRFCPDEIYKNYYTANKYFENHSILFYDKLKGKIWSLAYLISLDQWLFLTFDVQTKTFEEVSIKNGFDKNGKYQDGGFLSSKLEQNAAKIAFTDVYQDATNNIWWGTKDGVSKISPQSSAFQTIKTKKDDIHSTSSSDKNGNVWYTIEDTLFYYDVNVSSLASYPLKNHFNSNMDRTKGHTLFTIIDIYLDNSDTVWLATNDGLFAFNTLSKKFKRVDISTWQKSMLAQKQDYNQRYFLITCNGLSQEKNGDFWLSYFGRLVNWKVKENKAYSIVFPLWTWAKGFGSRTSEINIDPKGKVWVGTLDAGLHVFNPDDIKDPMDVSIDIFKTFNFEGAEPKFVDSKGNMWATSLSSGVIRINTETYNYTQFTKDEGLADNNTFNVIEDRKGRIWIGTANGLSCYTPETKKFKNYYKSYGLPSNIIGGRKSSLTSNGEIFIPTNKGIVIFDPDNIYTSSIKPRIAFTDFKVNGKELSISQKNSPLNSDISLSKAITLPYWQNDLSISFSALHFDDTQKNQYAVFMENDDENWRNIGIQHTVEYTNLNPGSYIFNVRASNSDGVWNKTGITLDITILPPWWATWRAYTIYIALIISLLVHFTDTKLTENYNWQKPNDYMN